MIRFRGILIFARTGSYRGLVRSVGRMSTGARVPVGLLPPRLRFTVDMESPDLIVRPRPPATEGSQAEREYFQELKATIDSFGSGLGRASAESLIKQCLADKRLNSASYLALRCIEENIELDQTTCNILLSQFSGHYMFDPACAVAAYLVRSGHGDINSSIVSLAIAGSIGTGRMKNAADLLLTIVEQRRSDLLDAIGTIEVRTLSLNSNSTTVTKLDSKFIAHGIHILVSALQEGWFSTASYKLFVSMLLASGRLDAVEALLSDSIDRAQESKLNLVALFNAFTELSTLGGLSKDKKTQVDHGRSMSKVLNILNSIIKSNSNSKEGEVEGRLAESINLPLFPTPLECEQFLKVFWKTADIVHRRSPSSMKAQGVAIAADIKDMHASLQEFSKSSAIGANFSVPWGRKRRALRILVDLLGFQQTARDKEYAIDLMKINVFKSGAYTRRNTAVSFESVDSITALNRSRPFESPHKLVSLPPQWSELSNLLVDAADPDTLMIVLTSVLHSMKEKHSNSVWALSLLEMILAQKEPHTIPAALIEEILDMCIANKDLYSILEVLGLVRERGIQLSEAVWSKVMTATWHGGTRYLHGLMRDRVFAQVLDFIKQCSGELDSESVAVLMRYLYFKKDAHNIFLYKIIDRLYKDKTQPITHFECTVLCALLFHRSSFLRTNKFFEMAQPVFSSSRFIVPTELGEIKLFDAMYELVDLLPDGFFNRYADAWPSLRSKQGRIDMFLLVEYLLYEENVSFLLTVPTHEKLRDVVSILTVYVAFLVGCNDNQYRKSFELLHRISTLYRQFEDNKRKKRLFEYSCPRKYHYHEPFSHFAFGWVESEEPTRGAEATGSDTNENGHNNVGKRGYTDDYDSSFSEDGNNSEPMNAEDLRARANNNVFQEPVRAIDVKNTNQRLNTGSAYLPVERLRFIPERSNN